MFSLNVSPEDIAMIKTACYFSAVLGLFTMVGLFCYVRALNNQEYDLLIDLDEYDYDQHLWQIKKETYKLTQEKLETCRTRIKISYYSIVSLGSLVIFLLLVTNFL